MAAKASDIHLKVGIPPAARVRGDLVFFRETYDRNRDGERWIGTQANHPSLRPINPATLLPSVRMICGVGPTKITPSRSQASTNSGFSDRKP